MNSQAKNHGIDWRVPSTVTRSDGRDEAPQAHARGGDEVADRPLDRERREEDQPQLDPAKSCSFLVRR